MADLSFILLGAIFVMLGWYWGGTTASRTTAVATGIPAALLGGVAIFADSPPVWVWALAGLGATFGALVALGALWEAPGDRALGLYALFFGIAAALIAGAVVQETDEFTNQALAAVVVVVVQAFIFISAALTPEHRGFRNFVGWLTLVGGALVAFLGFAESLAITIQG